MKEALLVGVENSFPARNPFQDLEKVMRAIFKGI